MNRGFVPADQFVDGRAKQFGVGREVVQESPATDAGPLLYRYSRCRGRALPDQRRNRCIENSPARRFKLGCSDRPGWLRLDGHQDACCCLTVRSDCPVQITPSGLTVKREAMAEPLATVGK